MRRVAALVALSAASAVRDFSLYQNCTSCTEAGYGWCTNVRRCGGFANSDCGDGEGEIYHSRETWVDPPSHCTTINSAADLSAVVKDASLSAVLVQFHAPWCGACQQLRPAYEAACETFAAEPGVVMARMDGSQHGEVAQTIGVKAFPTLKLWRPKAAGKPADYHGERTAEAIVKFINGAADTRRTVGGALHSSVGRIPQMDTLVGALFAAIVRQQQQQHASSGGGAGGGTGGSGAGGGKRPTPAEIVEVAGGVSGGLSAFYSKMIKRVYKRASAAEERGTAAVKAGHAAVVSERAKLTERIRKASAIKADLTRPRLKRLQAQLNVLGVFDTAYAAAISDLDRGGDQANDDNDDDDDDDDDDAGDEL